MTRKELSETSEMDFGNMSKRIRTNNPNRIPMKHKLSIAKAVKKPVELVWADGKTAEENMIDLGVLDEHVKSA